MTFGNGNDRSSGETADIEIEAVACVQAVATTLARLLGRQIAREQIGAYTGRSETAQAGKDEDRQLDILFRIMRWLALRG